MPGWRSWLVAMQSAASGTAPGCLLLLWLPSAISCAAVAQPICRALRELSYPVTVSTGFFSCEEGIPIQILSMQPHVSELPHARESRNLETSGERRWLMQEHSLGEPKQQ